MVKLIFLVVISTLASLASASGSVKGPGYEVVGGMGMMKYVIVTAGSNAAHLKYAAKAVCGSGRICIVKFWENEADAPGYSAMTDSQLDSMYAAYNKNMNTGLDRLLLCSKDGC